MKRRYGEPTGAGTTAGRSLAEEMASLCDKKTLACQKTNLFPENIPSNSLAYDSPFARVFAPARAVLRLKKGMLSACTSYECGCLAAEVAAVKVRPFGLYL
jgi:hypothetical protein